MHCDLWMLNAYIADDGKVMDVFRVQTFDQKKVQACALAASLAMLSLSNLF